jgi:hypothetical protein
MPAVSHDIDRVAVRFDDANVVADAGLLLIGTLAGRLGLEAATDEVCTVGFRPGRKLSTLVSSLVSGGRCIDDVDALRAGATARVLGHDTVASTTVGHWLRGVTFGHVRQLDRVAETMLARAWAAGAGPGGGRLVIDVDSTIVEVHGKKKQGAAYGYTRQLSLHPLVAVRAETGEILHVRTRKGSANTARGAVQFVAETHGRVRRAGATGQLLWRFDSGFWNNDLMELIEGYDGWFTVGIRMQKPIMAAIETIDDDAWVDIDGYIGARAQVAETVYGGRRLIVRRTLNESDQPTLVEDWRHHAFLTNLPGDLLEVDRTHRAHAVVELAIRDLKHDAGMIHMPSGIFQANAAWAVACTLAHNLVRWTQLLTTPDADVLRAGKTFRRRMLRLPGRLVHTARRWTLRLPTRWPWRTAWQQALADLRALPQPC